MDVDATRPKVSEEMVQPFRSVMGRRVLYVKPDFLLNLLAVAKHN